MKEVVIDTEFIKLSSFLKYVGIVSMGSDAKFIIINKRIKVNGEIAFEIRKKLRNGDIIEVQGIGEYKLKVEGMI